MLVHHTVAKNLWTKFRNRDSCLLFTSLFRKGKTFKQRVKLCSKAHKTEDSILEGVKTEWGSGLQGVGTVAWSRVRDILGKWLRAV